MKPWMIFLTVKRSSFLGSHFWFHLKMTLFIMLALLFSIFSASDICLKDRSSTLILDSTTLIVRICQTPFNLYNKLTFNLKKHFDVYTQNKKLTEENIVLKSHFHHSLALAAENKRLRAKLRIIDDLIPEFISVRVIGGIDSLYQKHLFLGGGIKAGIHLKKAVFMDRHIVGRVIQVGQYSTRVLKITDAHSHIPVVLEKSQIQGILSGDNTPIMKIKLIEQNLLSPTSSLTSISKNHTKSPKISKGEYVFSSGQGGIFPAGFIVGRIVNITPQEILVESLIENHPIDYVQVAKYFEEPL